MKRKNRSPEDAAHVEAPSDDEAPRKRPQKDGDPGGSMWNRETKAGLTILAALIATLIGAIYFRLSPEPISGDPFAKLNGAGATADPGDDAEEVPQLPGQPIAENPVQPPSATPPNVATAPFNTPGTASDPTQADIWSQPPPDMAAPAGNQPAAEPNSFGPPSYDVAMPSDTPGVAGPPAAVSLTSEPTAEPAANWQDNNAVSQPPLANSDQLGSPNGVPGHDHGAPTTDLIDLSATQPDVATNSTGDSGPGPQTIGNPFAESTGDATNGRAESLSEPAPAATPGLTVQVVEPATAPDSGGGWTTAPAAPLQPAAASGDNYPPADVVQGDPPVIERQPLDGGSLETPPPVASSRRDRLTPATSGAPFEPAPATPIRPYPTTPADNNPTPFEPAPTATAQLADTGQSFDSTPAPTTPGYSGQSVVGPVSTVPSSPQAMPHNSAGPATPAATVNMNSASEPTYVVAPNDNYWVISQKTYGDGAYFKALFEHNRDRYPRANRLRVGDQIRTPAVGVLREKYPHLCPRPASQSPQQQPGYLSTISTRRPVTGGQTYVVENGDTLYDIARFELGDADRWPEIYQLNRDRLGNNGDRLSPGMHLVLPGAETGTITRAPSNPIR